jgi:hypothetical protein
LLRGYFRHAIVPPDCVRALTICLCGGSSGPERLCFVVLSLFAIGYAFLAGTRSLSEYDLGWQLATGRWIAQQHQIPSTDVFSYTAQGQPWIYPVGSSLIFYAAYLVGGYALVTYLRALSRTMIEEVGFAADSLLEEAGFEPSVPHTKSHAFPGRLRSA